LKTNNAQSFWEVIRNVEMSQTLVRAVKDLGKVCKWKSGGFLQKKNTFLGGTKESVKNTRTKVIAALRQI